MKQIMLTDADALAYATAQGDLSAARFNLTETVRRILAVHGIDPAKPFQIDGNVITVPSEEAPHA